MEKYGHNNRETAKIGFCTSLKIGYVLAVCLRNNRPHFRAVRKVLWKMVTTCVRNRYRPDEIDTETDICTCLKSEFYFRFRWPPSTKSTLINFNSIRILVTNRGKYGHHNRKTVKIGFCTSLKSVSYFRFVSETIAFETTTFLSGMQNWWKSVKNCCRTITSAILYHFL